MPPAYPRITTAQTLGAHASWLVARGRRRILLAAWRDVTRGHVLDLRGGYAPHQILDLSADGDRTQVSARIDERGGRPAQEGDVAFNANELNKIVVALREVGAAPEAFPWEPGKGPDRLSPYPGLEPFTERHAAVFFGREGALGSALAALEQMCTTDTRILTVLAASGVGKSSFLRAGLWPRLGRLGMEPVALVRPGRGVLSEREGLFHAVARWSALTGRNLDAGAVRAAYQAGGMPTERLGRVVALVRDAVGDGRPLVIGVDQAEELYHPDTDQAAAEADAFRRG